MEKNPVYLWEMRMNAYLEWENDFSLSFPGNSLTRKTNYGSQKNVNGKISGLETKQIWKFVKKNI